APAIFVPPMSSPMASLVSVTPA
ncbi:MAG: hypothetical protein V7646_2933, partial [Pseudonocardia sp.]